MAQDTVGIAGLGSYLPSRSVQTRYVVEGSDIQPEKLDAIGTERLHVADEEELPSSMAVRACREAVEDAGVALSAIDLIVYCGSVKDHARWQAAAKVQSALGCDDCFVFDLYQSCNGQNVAMTVARSMVRMDPDIHHVLVVAAERWRSSLPRPVLGNSLVFGDGASAAVFSRNHDMLSVRASAFRTRGENHAVCCIPEVGADKRLSEEMLSRAGHWFQFWDPPIRSREDNLALAELTMGITAELLDEACAEAGSERSDVDVVVTANTSRRHIERLLDRLGLPRARNTAAYIAETGCLGTSDVYHNLQRGLREGLIRDGDLVAVVTAGGGHSFAVTLLGT